MDQIGLESTRLVPGILVLYALTWLGKCNIFIHILKPLQLQLVVSAFRYPSRDYTAAKPVAGAPSLGRIRTAGWRIRTG